MRKKKKLHRHRKTDKVISEDRAAQEDRIRRDTTKDLDAVDAVITDVTQVPAAAAVIIVMTTVITEAVEIITVQDIRGAKVKCANNITHLKHASIHRLQPNIRRL